MKIKELHINPTSLVTHDARQLVLISAWFERTAHLYLTVYRDGQRVVEPVPFAASGGQTQVRVLLPVQTETFDAVWEITDGQGMVERVNECWTKPREWTLYVMVSSHTDIGLHNSQYIQRFNSERFIDEASALCDETEQYAPCDRYRYVMEGTWFWNNYGMDRGQEAAERIVEAYIKPGKMGVCCGVAGNHIHTYGLEELCRSAYERKRLEENWGIESRTMSMIDNNGMPMSMLQPYADAGYRNIIFSPNQWNPLPSTIWPMDPEIPGGTWNTNASGGGSRIDVRYASNLPMVFEWESGNGRRLTVWCCTQYHWGGFAFGLFPTNGDRSRMFSNLTQAKDWAELQMARQLEQLEARYPYDLWLLVCYGDDQAPGLDLQEQIRDWNRRWKWPKLCMLGNPDAPFEELRARFGDQIPVLHGDITGGWYQHPLTVPELMAEKYEADRALAGAEKWATVAGILDGDYAYPAEDFRRAWDYLLFNDEHSYGTSGYQGRRVYETWMQHRDWIGKAGRTACRERDGALRTIAEKIAVRKACVAVFNETAQERCEWIFTGDGEKAAVVTVPPFGYCTAALDAFSPLQTVREALDAPPVVENRYYRVEFAENGSMSSIFDKLLGRELLDRQNVYRANEIVYTRDNHKTFLTPENASFTLERSAYGITVTVRCEIQNLGAEIVQVITLPEHEKRIEIENRLNHVRDMVNKNRYYRYLYFAFPFLVENCRRLCHLGGTVAEYAKDVTGHGTDVYMAAHEWCCSENDDFGAALLMRDTQLVEYDHIHPDKTDFGAAGAGSQIFSYAANDWLQMHTPGGSHLDYRFRYAITSYAGGYERAGIPHMAERFVTPVQTLQLPAQAGSLPALRHSFLEIDPEMRFVCLKRADDGRGIIARIIGDAESCPVSGMDAERVCIDETPWNGAPTAGFAAWRLEAQLRLRERPPEPIGGGMRYTGLITEPMAAAGEGKGHLYLLWGANTQPDFSHYRLYRSRKPGFVPDETTFLADIPPEEYCVGRYEDTGLEDHAWYYYRFCPVDTRGVCGPMSAEFGAVTREEPEDPMKR